MKKTTAVLGAAMLAGTFLAASAHGAIVATNSTFTGLSSIEGWHAFMLPSKATVEPVISYSSGAGPRWDYWDNDDAVSQVGRETSESNDVVAAGGTITGDGVLADGALWFNATDGTKGNEFIAYDLAGTMEEGETITFSYNAFNNADYWNMVLGQLWDLTVTQELAVADWITVLANSAVDYKPYDGVVAYTATAAEAGHRLAIVFREWGTTSRRDPYIDNYSVLTTAAPPPGEQYEAWALGEGLTTNNNAYAADPDGDGLDNLSEYGLGGQPTNAANQGLVPVYGTMEVGGTNWMTYVYARRSDYSFRGLGYGLETATDLALASWTNANYEVLGTEETGGDFDYVTNRMPTAVESEKFLRLRIEITP